MATILTYSNSFSKNCHQQYMHTFPVHPTSQLFHDNNMKKETNQL